MPADLSGAVGRFPIFDVWPVVDSGQRPAKAVENERIRVRFKAIREGHDSLGVNVVLTAPDGSENYIAAHLHTNDTYHADIRAAHIGAWSFRVEAWDDVWGTWHHAAGLKVPAGVDVELELLEGSLLLERALASTLKDAPQDLRIQLTAAIAMLRDTNIAPADRLAAAFAPEIDSAMHHNPIRQHISATQEFPIKVERKRALYGSWYEFFPRSEGATLEPYVSGTFRTAAKRLPAVAEMGFDVLYIPPIHPVGVTNRKGRNNTLTPGPEDVGSPWAIGGAAGGHDAINPELGTFEDFNFFVKSANDLGIEVALDLALQASPDHPWVQEHPEWFKQRADGSIAFAENPPKKYQDIYPMYFDQDPEGLYNEIERIVRFWMNHGVRIFRVDNPHTKPVWMWQRLIDSINATDPDVIFLAEAFTAPAMMRMLGEIGYQQSYTYFTWRNDKKGIVEYMNELSGHASAYMRPNFFVNTPDINPAYLQTSGPAGFAIRATLAATLAPTYGVYAGFELYEAEPYKEGGEEYLDSEKFELKPRDWEAAAAEGRTLAPYIKMLNRIRREHPALQSLRDVVFHKTSNDEVIAFSKQDGDDIVLVICTLDPKGTHSSSVQLDMPALGFDWDDQLLGNDLVTDTSWTWSKSVDVQLDPFRAVAHIVTLRKMP